MKKTIGTIAVSTLAVITNASALDSDTLLREKTEKEMPQISFEIMPGMRMDHFKQGTYTQNAYFYTLGGEVNMAYSSFRTGVDGYIGCKTNRHTAGLPNDNSFMENRMRTASVNGNVGLALDLIQKKSLVLAMNPFVGYSFDSNWMPDNQVMSWQGPTVGTGFAFKPTSSFNVDLVYSHHFLDQKTKVDLEKMVANAQGEKVKLNLNYAINDNLDIGINTACQYFYQTSAAVEHYMPVSDNGDQPARAILESKKNLISTTAAINTTLRF